MATLKDKMVEVHANVRQLGRGQTLIIFATLLALQNSKKENKKRTLQLIRQEVKGKEKECDKWQIISDYMTT
tara:strand:- start:217 stop:432 length:216 start_codon:yes stop_codon:yes gene_type:complete